MAQRIGREFEERCCQFLNSNLRSSLRVVGGSNDRGIDLSGEWGPHLLSVQCKASLSGRPLGARVFREVLGSAGLEGSRGVLMVAVSNGGAGITDEASRALHRIRVPLFVCVFSESPGEEFGMKLSQFLMNQEARIAVPELSVASRVNASPSGHRRELSFRIRDTS